MNESKQDEKSCGPQLFDGTPQQSWGVDRLRDYACDENDAIEESERSVTSHYWRLGKTLVLLRKNFSRGQWGPLLNQMGIDKTRASKAVAIFRSFENEEAVKDFSVAKAYEKRQRKPRRSTPQMCDKKVDTASPSGLAKWLHQVGMGTDLYGEEVASLSSSQAADLLPSIGALIADLTALRDRLRQKSSET